MIFCNEMWLDLAEGGGSSKLRFSVKVEELAAYNLNEGESIEIPLSGPYANIGYLIAKMVTSMKGLAILEVVQLRLANEQYRPRLPAVSLSSAHEHSLNKGLSNITL